MLTSEPLGENSAFMIIYRGLGLPQTKCLLDRLKPLFPTAASNHICHHEDRFVGRSSGKWWVAARMMRLFKLPSSEAVRNNYERFILDVVPTRLFEADRALYGAISHWKVSLNLETKRRNLGVYQPDLAWKWWSARCLLSEKTISNATGNPDHNYGIFSKKTREKRHLKDSPCASATQSLATQLVS